jgi:SdrD B-like domain
MLSAGTQGMAGGMPDASQAVAVVAATAFVAPPPVNMGASAPVPAAISAATLAPDPPGSLSGFVFLESATGSPNFNPASPAAGESPLAGVTVTLTGPSGTETAVTDKTGLYTFNDLTAGTYSLTITPPTGNSVALAIASGNGVAGQGTISSITIGSGQNQTNENFAVTTGSQLEQVFFTASALVSGVQIPIAPFEHVTTPAPLPSVPQQFSMQPVFTPAMTGMIVPAAGARPIRLGGSGGDTTLGGANPNSSLYADDVLDDIWPAFGNQQTDNWLNEGPDQAILERLSTLGNMDLLNAGGSRVFTPDSSDSKDGTNDLFNFNGRFDDDWIDYRDFVPDATPSESHAQGWDAGHAEQAVLLDPVVQTEAPARLREADGSLETSASVGLLASWMLTTGNRGEGTRPLGNRERVGYFERRRKVLTG